MRQRRDAPRFELPLHGAAAENRAAFTPAVERHDGAAVERGAQIRRRRMSDVMRYVVHARRVEGAEEARQKRRQAPNVIRAQPFIVERGHVVARVRRERRVVAVGDCVEFGCGDPAPLETPGDRTFGQLPCRKRHAGLRVLAACKALLFGRRDDHAVDDQRGRRIVKDRIDTQYPHVRPMPKQRLPKTRSVGHLLRRDP